MALQSPSPSGLSNPLPPSALDPPSSAPLPSARYSQTKPLRRLSDASATEPNVLLSTTATRTRISAAAAARNPQSPLPSFNLIESTLQSRGGSSVPLALDLSPGAKPMPLAETTGSADADHVGSPAVDSSNSRGSQAPAGVRSVVEEAIFAETEQAGSEAAEEIEILAPVMSASVQHKNDCSLHHELQSDDRDELDFLATQAEDIPQALSPSQALAAPSSQSPAAANESAMSSNGTMSASRSGVSAQAGPATPANQQPVSLDSSSTPSPSADPELQGTQNLEVPAGLRLPSPPRRALRSRKPGQLNPYTVEMAMYKRRLERNDWEDAVVTDQQFRRRMREERERAAADELPVGSSDWQLREAEAEERRERRKAKKAEMAEKEKQREAQNALYTSAHQSRTGEEANTSKAGHSSSKRRRVHPSPASEIFARFGGLLSDDEAESQQPTVGNVTARTYSSSSRKKGRSAKRTYEDTDSSSGQEAGQLRERTHGHSRLVASSSDEDESLVPQTLSRNARRVSIDSASHSSSEDSVDYDRYFRQLKRMMPIHMARKHIDDLKNMRRGKAYHSDGHVSDTPEPSIANSGSESDAGRDATTPSTSPMATYELQPGEARKRIRPVGEAGGGRDDARFDLIGDEASDSSDGGLSVASSSTSSSAFLAQGRGRDADIRWWTRPESNLLSDSGTKARRSAVDDVDRMLSRSTTSKPRRKKGYRGTGHSRSRPRGQTRSDDVARVESGTTRTPLRDRALNIRQSSKHIASHRKQRAQQYSRRSGPRLPPRRRGSNPPVVQPKALRRLDLMSDEVLFDVELLRPELQLLQTRECDKERLSEESRHAIASYKAVNRPNRPIMRRARKPVLPAAHSHPPSMTREEDLSSSPVPHIVNRTFGRTTSRGSYGISSPAAHDDIASAQHPQGRLVQQHFDARGTLRRPGQGEPVRKGPSSHQLDANAWADLANLRLDFGIRPLAAGTSFAPTTNLGKGRLHELISLSRERSNAAQAWTRLRAVHVFDLHLPANPDPDTMLDLLPAIFDGIYTAVESIASRDDECPHTRTSVDEVLRYLSLSLSALLCVLSWQEVSHVAVAVHSQMDHMFERFQGAGIGSESVNERSAQQTASLMLALRWFNVEICWRTLTYQRGTLMDYDDNLKEEEEFVLACQGVIVSLLSHGLHQTWREVQRVCVRRPQAIETDVALGQPQHIEDYSAEVWVCLIHLLNTAGTVLGPHAEFWNVFEAGLAQWRATLPPRRKVLMAEMIWYAVLSLCALSQFSASTGTSGSTPLLTQHWPLVVQALTATKLRYDESVEQAMPSAAVSRRDQYIRAVLQRCFNLTSLWRWSMDGADAALSKLFDIFNDHKLADLPSEEDHDFPPFLREYNARLLFDESKREATSYHVFLKLLARGGRDLQASARDARDAERRVARLFSRVCPVRVMSFSRSSPPTSRERSSLFNHYAVVMTHLYLVPSAAAQRLRQIKSFLVFKDADAQSQVTCIRAMLYAAVIFRHYKLEISPISAWFSAIFKTLVADAEEVNKLSSRQEPGHHFESLRQARRVNSLLITSLRSIQHIIEHSGLREEGLVLTARVAEPSLPDVLLLDRAWTSDILESQTAIDPAVGMEVLKCIQVCLLQRKTCMDSVIDNNRMSESRNEAQDAGNEHATSESQNSVGDSFEGEGDYGFDFTDPALDDLLGDSAAAVERGERLAVLRQADLSLAQHLRDNISPSFFRLISNIYHPDRQSEGRRISLGLSDSLHDKEGHHGGRQYLADLLKTSTRRRYVELLIDCWAGCAHVLVQNGLRDWNGYLTYGNESWKRLVDAMGKRDVGLRFLQNVAVLDPSAYRAHKTEFLQVWFQSAAARSLSVQADFTRTLFADIDTDMPWLRGSLAQIRSESIDRGEEAVGMTLETFLRYRTLLVTSAVSEMARDFSNSTSREGSSERSSSDLTQRRGMVFSCLSGFLSAMRSQLEALPVSSSMHPPQQQRLFSDGDIDPDRGSTSVDQYIIFCRETTQAISARGGHTILRGVKGELDRTVALLTRTIEARAIQVRTVEGGCER